VIGEPPILEGEILRDGSVPMISLDHTILVQMANFIILVLVLNHLLYKPLLKILDERKEKIEGTLEEAERMMEEAERKLDEYNNRIRQARQQAQQIVAEGRLKAAEEQKRVLAEVRKEAEERLEKLQKELEAQKASAREVLRRQAEALSIRIAERVLGRSLSEGQRGEVQ
jgi:F-type H+-transporting ATPase subunit b